MLTLDDALYDGSVFSLLRLANVPCSREEMAFSSIYRFGTGLEWLIARCGRHLLCSRDSNDMRLENALGGIDVMRLLFNLFLWVCALGTVLCGWQSGHLCESSECASIERCDAVGIQVQISAGVAGIVQWESCSSRDTNEVRSENAPDWIVVIAFFSTYLNVFWCWISLRSTASIPTM